MTFAGANNASSGFIRANRSRLRAISPVHRFDGWRLTPRRLRHGSTRSCPTDSGHYVTLFEVAKEIGRRLSSIFLRDGSGRRPVYRGTKKFQEDPYWKDYILYYEYFHGDNGAGLGASHQTGWTGTIARLLDLFARLTPEGTLLGAQKYMAELTREQVSGTTELHGETPVRNR